MHITSIIALALPILASAEADAKPNKHHAKVVNNCAHTVYVQSVPNDGSQPSKVLGLTGHGQGSYSESFAPNGASIRVSRSKDLVHPLSFDYTPSGDRVYYDLGDQFGNPFIGVKNTLIPEDKSCARFQCKPNDEGCYSNLATHPHIENCKQTSMTVTLCA